MKIADLLSAEGVRLYPASIKDVCGGRVFVASKDGQKYVGSEGVELPERPDTVIATTALRRLTWPVYEALRSLTDLRPSICDSSASFGTGDRLGMVTAAHLQAVSHSPLFPVVAQQSPRELKLTRRSFQSVLCDAALGVLESGYSGRWGADADHIKAESDLMDAVRAGYTMYTLDLSDWTPSAFASDSALSSLSRQIITEWAGKSIREGAVCARFTEEDLTESAAVYEKALQSAVNYNRIIRSSLSAFDLEISIDEGDRLTTPADHLYVAQFLRSPT